MHDITIEQLRTFRAVVSSGSFTRAAKELSITQPAVSHRVHQIEEALGAELFERKPGYGLTLTDAGQSLVRFADDMIDRLGAIRAMFESDKTERETLSVGCTAAIIRYELPPLLVKFRRVQTGVRIRLVQIAHHEISERLLNGDVDVGVQAESVVGQTLRRIPLFREELLLVAPPEHPVTNLRAPTARTCAMYPFCLPITTSPGLRQMIERWAEANNVRLNVSLEMDSIDGLKEAVIHGLGLAILPEFAMREELKAGRLHIVPIRKLPAGRRYFLTYSGKRPMGTPLRSLIALLKPSRLQTRGLRRGT